MHKTDKPVLSLLTKGVSDFIPVWLMRQAGRYLPEYNDLRKKADGFVDFCLTPTLAAEATLQPLRRFDLDVAILFADILLVPHALGVKVDFIEKEGPRLQPIEDEKQAQGLIYRPERIAPVFETIQRVKPLLKSHQTLIGFCGGLWTVACYMIEGRGRQDFVKAKEAALHQPAFLKALIEKIEAATLVYLLGQIEAGAEVIQIFESHAGQLSGQAFQAFVIEPTKMLVEGIRKKHPSFPIIGFPRGASLSDYKKYFEQTGISGCSLDQNISLDSAKKELLPLGCLQGNLDPDLLLAGGKAMDDQAEKIMNVLGEKLIFNLGHGVIKETNPDHIARLVALVHGFQKGEA
ncbi:MAG: uroporphyrinogen decarboxylase [Bdellovibrionales bacterium]